MPKIHRDRPPTYSALPIAGVTDSPVRLANGLARASVVADVSDFGAKGDNRTDNTAAFQTAADELPHGAVLTFPRGRYRITTVDWTVRELRSIRFLGLGGQSANDGGWNGATIVVSDSGVGFDFDQSSLIHEGPIMEYLNFIDDSPAGDAVLVSIGDMNYWTMRSCTFRPGDTRSDGGVGLRLIRGEDNAWGMIDQCRFIGLDVGVYSDRCFGNVIQGGNFISHTGQLGVYLDDSSQHWRIMGPKFDGPGSGIHLDGAFANTIVGAHFERVATGVRVSTGSNGNGQLNQVGSCWFGTNTGTGIAIEDPASYGNMLIANSFQSPIGTKIDDNGTDTLILDYHHGLAGNR